MALNSTNAILLHPCRSFRIQYLFTGGFENIECFVGNNNKAMIVATRPGYADIWVLDRSTYTPIVILHGHDARITSFHIFKNVTTNCMCLASGSTDGIIIVWRLDTYEKIKVMKCYHNITSIYSFVDKGAGKEIGKGNNTAWPYKNYNHNCNFSITGAILGAGILMGKSNAVHSTMISVLCSFIGSRLFQLLSSDKDKSIESCVGALSGSVTGLFLASVTENISLLTSSNIVGLLGKAMARLALGVSGLVGGSMIGIGVEHVMKTGIGMVKNAVATVKESFEKPNPINVLVSTSDDNCLRLWNVRSGACVSNIKLQNWSTRCTCTFVDKNGNHILAIGGYDQFIYLWDVRNNMCIRALNGINQTVYCMCIVWRESRQLIVSGGSLGFIQIWDVESGECVNILYNFTRNVTSLVTLSNRKGNSIFVSNSLTCNPGEYSIKVWDVKTFSCVANLNEGPYARISVIKGLYNEVKLLSLRQNWTFLEWDIKSLINEVSLYPNLNIFVVLYFNPDSLCYTFHITFYFFLFVYFIRHMVITEMAC